MSQLQSGDSVLMQELGDFPNDDLNVEQVEKECHTVRHSVPDNGWVTGRHRLTEEYIHTDLLENRKILKAIQEGNLMFQLYFCK